MNRINEITQACVMQILGTWDEWNQHAEMSASVAQDHEVWKDEMHASLWNVVNAAVEEAAGIKENANG